MTTIIHCLSFVHSEHGVALFAQPLHRVAQVSPLWLKLEMLPNTPRSEIAKEDAGGQVDCQRGRSPSLSPLRTRALPRLHLPHLLSSKHMLLRLELHALELLKALRAWPAPHACYRRFGRVRWASRKRSSNTSSCFLVSTRSSSFLAQSAPRCTLRSDAATASFPLPPALQGAQCHCRAVDRFSCFSLLTKDSSSSLTLCSSFSNPSPQSWPCLGL